MKQLFENWRQFVNEEDFYEVDAIDEDEEYCPECRQLEEKKKKACKPSKGKRFAKRVDGKCRSFGQSGQAKSGGDRIRPGTKKGDAYCARSAGIKKCKNPPCANTLSRRKWKCRGKKSMKEQNIKILISDRDDEPRQLDRETIEDIIQDKFSFSSAQSSQHRWSPGQPIIDYAFDERAGEWKFKAVKPAGERNEGNWPTMISNRGESIEDFLTRVKETPHQLNLFENWRKFIEEETKDTYGSEVVDRNRATFKNALIEDEGSMSPDKAIAKEGGALGFSKWEELTGMSRDELEKYVKDNDHIKIHKHGDIIATDGLSEDIELNEDVVVDEGKICAAGIAWAKRKYDKWPSAYASMGASKYCKKKGKKKNEDIQQEGELKKWREENWTQSDGTPCGDAKAQKNPKRCKPAKKWATMSKSEKTADNKKKKAGGKKGKQFVSATKKGKVKGYSE